MAAKVAQMTSNELQEMIGAIVEQKLLELFGDPEVRLPLRKSLKDRLLRQRQAVAKGQRGQPLDKVVRQVGLG